MRAREWLDNLAKRNSLVLSPQSISEFYHVSRRRFSRIERKEILQACDRFLTWCTAELDTRTVQRAWSIEESTHYQWFDCLLLASAALAGCGFFLSEDLQHGRMIDDLKVVDPFKLLPSEVFISNHRVQE